MRIILRIFQKFIQPGDEEGGVNMFQLLSDLMHFIPMKMKFIDKKQLLKLAEGLRKSDYGKYLFSIANEKIFTFHS